MRHPKVCVVDGCPNQATPYSGRCLDHPPPRSPSSKATGTSAYKRARVQALKRDNWTCQLCGDPATQADHIQQVALGGSHELSNLRAVCASCNQARNAQRWQPPQ
jgi:5-methylcytosine-specific restriction protein A